MAVGLTSWLQVDDTAVPPAVGLTSWLQVEDAAAPPPPPPPPPTGPTARTSWLLIDQPPNEPVPNAPQTVAGDATSASAGFITWVDVSSNETGFQVQLESPAGSGNWVDAVGSANPTAPNVQSFAFSGLTGSTDYTPRVRSLGAAGNSAYTEGAAFGTDNGATGGGTIPGGGIQAAVAFVEPSDDTALVLGGPALVVAAAVAFQESGDDVVTALATLQQGYTATLAFSEVGDDLVTAQGFVRLSVQASLALSEDQDDWVSVQAVTASAFPAFLAFVEQGDDAVRVSAVVASSAINTGTLGALAAEYEQRRSMAGLFIGYEQVLQCAIMATRFYAGWATLEDPASQGSVFSITADTTVSRDEWAIIAPLFHLYCDREHAVVVESSATAGLQPVGRSSSEVSSDIQLAENELPQKAYVEPAWSVGFPPAA